MSGRTRKPTLRALEAAETALHVRSHGGERSRLGVPSSSSRLGSPASSTASGPSAAAAPVKRNGRAVNARGRQAVAREAKVAQHQLGGAGEDDEDDEDAEGMDDGAFGEQEQDMTLYCVCLGYDTGEQPMIQCEHCSNWFHFSCVGLTEQSAASIEAYSCDMCEQMGMGTTRLLTGATAQPAPASTFYDAGADEQFEEGDDQDDEDEDEDEDEVEDDDAAAEGAKKRRKKSTGGRAPTRRKTDQAASDDDDEYDGETDDEGAAKKRKAKRPSKPSNRRASAQQDAKPATSGAVVSVPQSDKTRTHVVKQLTTIFSSIFSASSGDGSSAGIEVRSAAFAEEVETELFDGFAEVDDKNTRGPRAKYVGKFRSLHFNLKSNAYLRSRIAANELSAHDLIHLSAEELQTPELRAMAESVRAASLRNSLKEALAAPTAKRTHKGEEEIDNEASRIIAQEQAERAKEEELKREAEKQQKEQHRERSGSVAADSPGHAAFAGSPLAAGASPGAEPESPVPGASRARSSLVPAGSPQPGDQSPFDGAGSPAADRDGSPSHRPSISNVDMTSIWGKAKVASPTVDEDKLGAEAGDSSAAPPASDDPFGPTGHDEGESGDDDFEDDLFRDANASPKKGKARGPPAPALSDLPPVWAGDLIVPEEGGFPSFAVQVGGRPLGSKPETWKQLLPRGLSTAGRLPTPTANKYLVECALAPTRELVVVALLPDTTGPSADFPHKPVKDSCLAKHGHIVETYLKRDRVGVVQPPREMSKLVKDIYIVPLRKDASVPDWVELIDSHCVPPKSKREGDIILSALVVQKGVLPTVKPAALPPTPTGPPLPASTAPVPPPLVAAPPLAPAAPLGAPPFAQHPTQASYSPAPAGFSPVPPPQPGFGSPPPPAAALAAPATAAGGFDPSAVQSLLAQVDPATINSILANPSLLNAIPGFSAAPSQPPAGGLSPFQQQSPPPPDAGGATGVGGGRGPAVHPSRLAMMSGASPPPPTGPAAMQPPAGQFGAPSGDSGWGMRNQQQPGPGGYSPPGQGRYGGGGPTGYGY